MASIDIAKEIAKALSEYKNEVTEGLEEAKEKVAKNTVKHLKSLDHPKLTGDYAKGWSRKKVGTAQVIHNRTDYQLTHLLENGHVNRDGSRTEAIPHIQPAEEKAIDEYLEEVEKVIKR
ncbi:HK97 gp10 family phage protein [Metabacillus halosaccharovorans]|uniref:HK97 gp10 family phage protein n=1 Tax=Metabacillus halosaccharovorans TaxID=930124 RepID=UPI002041364D|nr:HK97 gp10 family phage protein [Metabacillus halosaccharovorans]MCM3444379.1 HK97 gp10 family phage protein [Metabacillus halosaccharovorans]